LSNWSLAAVAALGLFHGLNPAMGWLFAVAIGFRDRTWRAVVGSLGPIAAGHAAAMAVAVVVFDELRVALPSGAVRIAGAIALLAFATARLSRERHPRWVGMNLSRYELAGWSFLMSTAHGAGLMLIPVVAGSSVGTHADMLMPGSVLVGGEAVLVHTGVMVAVAAVVGLVVYRVVGVGILRRGWLNLDRVWTYALGAGALVMLLAG
jgi:hypothetical protein